MSKTLKDLLDGGAEELHVLGHQVYRFPKANGEFQYWLACPTEDFVCVYDTWLEADVIYGIINDSKKQILKNGG